MDGEYLCEESRSNKMTSREKILTVFCVIGVVVSVALLVSLIVVIANKNKNDHSLDGTCLSQACIMESSAVLSKMNSSVDPCDDFYEFACGSFLKETIIPDDKTSVSSFTLVDKTLNEQLRVIISEPIQPNEIAPFQNIKRLYQACMNTNLIDSLGAKPLKDVIESMGGWPLKVGDSWDAAGTWTWQGAMLKSRQNGHSFDYIYSFYVSIDPKNNSKRVIEIDQPSLSINREFLIKKLEEPFVKAYHDYQVDIAYLFGANRSRASEEMAAVLNFEIELAEISMASEDRRDSEKLYNVRNISRLDSEYDYNDWLNNFNSILPTESQLSATDIVVVGDLNFFEKLGDLLKNTPKRVIANYVVWRHAMESVDYLSEPFRKLKFQFSKAVSGKESPEPRWIECVEEVLEFYPEAFGALYVRKHFKKDAKTAALTMVNNIMHEFNTMLENNSWMDKETKKEAIKKANAIKAKIGFADELLNDTKIVEYYNTFPVTVNASEYFASICAINHALTTRLFKKLREAVDKNDWTTTVPPAIVNAYYNWQDNSINFPAGILQGAFFNAKRPQYMNYGGIGFVIGHEITHGFDDQGSQYDSEGNLRDWWANKTKEAFLEKAQCIIDQYDAYVEPLTGLNVSGINTQGENIADNGGIEESYRAYVQWAEQNPEKKLPGLDYTPQQMFWVSAAQVWCGLYRNETMKTRVTTDSHSPGQFRVIGSMSNSKEFAKDFKCSKSSKMNPPNKCVVW